jgi:MobA/VirD2-like, nuclease domain
MIVKAIAHKNSSKTAMQKLIRYVFAHEKLIDASLDRKPLIVKQFISGYDLEKWADSFKTNDDNRHFTHKHRTVLRHEIISFAPESAEFLTRDKLKTFAKYYLKNRSPQSMGICGVHYEKSIHIHFIISGVSIDGKSTRISRKEFKAFKIKLQEFQKQKFPELSHSIVEHSKKKAFLSS